ncbi:MAG: hypothetical protein ACE5JX_17895, partial [Acidobacteriota bacterium]
FSLDKRGFIGGSIHCWSYGPRVRPLRLIGDHGDRQTQGCCQPGLDDVREDRVAAGEEIVVVLS